MTNFHIFLSILELVIILFFGVCVFVDRNKKWNLYARFFIALFIVIINIIQLALEVMLEQNFVLYSSLSIMMILLWGMDIFIYADEIKRKKFRKK